MLLDVLRRRYHPAQWLAWGLALWTVCLLVILVRLYLMEYGRQSLYPVYEWAGTTWRKGGDLYPTERKGWGYPLFRYSPTAAALMAPLSRLPSVPADMVWHVISWAALFGASCWWAWAVVGPARRETVGLLLLLLLPLAIGNLNNAQSNTLVLAAVLAGLAAAAGQRWNLAAGFIAAACLLKVYPIAVGLLLCLLFPRRFALRLVGALALGLALSFALQEPSYVQRQYTLWLNYLTIEDRSGWELYHTNIDFQLLCRVWLTPISMGTYHRIQLAAGGSFALICLAAVRAGWRTEKLLPLVLGLGGVWMTVFGPATESPTYLLLAPTAAEAVFTSRRDRRSMALRAWQVSVYGILLSAQVVAWFPSLFMPYRALGPQPIAGLLLAVGLLVQLFRQPDESEDISFPRSGRVLPRRSPAKTESLAKT